MAIPKGRTLALGAAAALASVPALAAATTTLPHASTPVMSTAATPLAPVSLATALAGVRTVAESTVAAALSAASDTTVPSRGHVVATNGAADTTSAATGATVAAGTTSTADTTSTVAARAAASSPPVRDRTLLVRVHGGALQRITVRPGLDPAAIAASLRRHPGTFTSAGADFIATAAGDPVGTDDSSTTASGDPVGTGDSSTTASGDPVGTAAADAIPAAAPTADTAPSARATTQTGTLPTSPSTTTPVATTPAPPSTTPAATTPSDGIAVPRVVQGATTLPAAIKGWIPNDHIGNLPWWGLQWNFVGQYGVNASQAWAVLRQRGPAYAGGVGVKVAVVDSGVAYRNRGPYRMSPDLPPARILPGYDFVDNDRFPDDQSGHGTHVASTIAAATDNDAGLTGLAYNAEILPVRVLDAMDQGDVVAIARGIRYAVREHARIINLSIDFPVGITEADIPEVMSALSYARHKGVLVVASSGNNGGNRIALPARAPSVLSVGASTARGCQSVYSNAGAELDIAAPGGGQDHAGQRGCHPNRVGPPISQITILDSPDPKQAPDPSLLGVPIDYVGTSMAASHVSGVAALVLGSGILGKNARANLLAAYLVRTTTDLGTKGRDDRFGAGLVDAAAAVTRNRRSKKALRAARRAVEAAAKHTPKSLPVL